MFENKRLVMALVLIALLGVLVTSCLPEDVTVNIINRCGCAMTVEFKGPSNKTVSVPQGGTRTVTLRSGQYTIDFAGPCGSGSGDVNFTPGTWTLTLCPGGGGLYSVEQD